MVSPKSETGELSSKTSPPEPDQGHGISLDRVRSRLAVLWLGGSGTFTFLLVLQTLLGKYRGIEQEVWGWALPTILPTLGMICTVLGYTALDPKQARAEVRTDFYRLSYILSLAYLFFVSLTLLLQPFTTYQPIQLMRMANLWLGPFQGLVSSLLGVLFVTKKLRQ